MRWRGEKSLIRNSFADVGKHFTTHLSRKRRLKFRAALQLVLGQDLFEPYNFGIGALVVIDTSNRGREATANDLGDRVKVYWFSTDELV